LVNSGGVKKKGVYKVGVDEFFRKDGISTKTLDLPFKGKRVTGKKRQFRCSLKDSEERSRLLSHPGESSSGSTMPASEGGNRKKKEEKRSRSLRLEVEEMSNPRCRVKSRR